jgi:hypothetical protein
MSAEVIIAQCENLHGVAIVIIQQGSSYMVGELKAGCKHERGFKAEKIEPELYAWVCTDHCGFTSASHPTDPTAVRYVRHVPGPEDKVLPKIDYKAGER